MTNSPDQVRVISETRHIQNIYVGPLLDNIILILIYDFISKFYNSMK